MPTPTNSTDAPAPGTRPTAGSRPSGAARKPRKPAWLKVPLPGGEGYAKLKGLARELKLHTVCEEARCPNVGECWSGAHPTMTLMVLGDECTRRCRFCAVKTLDRPAPPDPNEPAHVGQAIAEMQVGYVVITSVDRDDLPDGGAGHYGECVSEIRARSPRTVVETLIPDYTDDNLALLMRTPPDVLAHNVEVVPRLQRKIRDPRCSYERSLDTLRQARALRRDRLHQVELMNGGARRDAGRGASRPWSSCAASHVDFMTIGQYLRPTARSTLRSSEYVEPARFADYQVLGEKMGFSVRGLRPARSLELQGRRVLLRAHGSREAPEAKRSAPNNDSQENLHARARSP